MNDSTSTHTSNPKGQVTNEMKEDGFRVRVCLQRFFSDERSRAYVSVVRRLPVSWLRQRLRHLFSLQGSFCLCSRGHLLHPDEPLSLLQPDDPVEVIPLPERTLDGDENGLMCSMNEMSHEIESNIPPKKFTKLITEKLTHETDKDILLRMKEKALAILDTCNVVTSNTELSIGPMASATGGNDKPQQTRRRVRRRKRRFSGEESSRVIIHEKDVTDSNKDEGEGTLTNVFMTSTPSCSKLSAVQLKPSRVGVVMLETVESKNTAEGDTSTMSRRARLVRSLSPSYGQTFLTEGH